MKTTPDVERKHLCVGAADSGRTSREFLITVLVMVMMMMVCSVHKTLCITVYKG